MANELILIFSADRIRELMDYNPDKIVVRSRIEEAVLEDSSKAGVVRVYADAVKERSVVATVSGCPDPPCSIED
jgi:hypothetical protein